jgi:hypothetical protein
MTAVYGEVVETDSAVSGDVREARDSGLDVVLGLPS